MAKHFNSYSEVESFIKDFISEIRKNVLISENKMAFAPLKFRDHHSGQFQSYGQMKAKGLKLIKTEPNPGSVDIKNAGTGKVPMVFYVGNIARYIYGRQQDGTPVDILSFKDFLEAMTKHECLHIYQFYWLYKNSRDFKRSMELVKMYKNRVKYTDQEFEKEAFDYMFGKPIRHVSEYMSQFLA